MDSRSFTLLIYSGARFFNGNAMQTSLFAMFPSQTQTVALDIALQHASSIFEHDLVVVIESEQNSER
ncbi:hypothetical protein [Vibrio taketomensis]|uniref:hypothetical protein n=1 Tax=Vibrio taketomensis TaxID=2572923 RepID=UPI0013897879|nr:hypothetical protein [Vibrio taketomensis]